MIRSALEHGKHVITDAAFAISADHARSYSEAAREYGRKTLIVYEPQWCPAVDKMMSLVDAGYIGRRTWSTDSSSCPASTRHPHDSARAATNGLPMPENGGSALRNFGAHVLDPLIRMFGDVTDVAGGAETFHKEIEVGQGTRCPGDLCDTSAFFVRFASRAIGTIAVGWSETHAEGFRLNAYGSAGRLLV